MILHSIILTKQEVAIYKVFIENQVLHFRDSGGNEFKELNKLVKMLPNNRGQKDYIEISLTMREKLSILETRGYNSEEHNSIIQEKRAEYQKYLLNKRLKFFIDRINEAYLSRGKYTYYHALIAISHFLIKSAKQLSQDKLNIYIARDGANFWLAGYMKAKDKNKFKANNIIHRDLRPHNIVIVKNNENFDIKVIDFQYMINLDCEISVPDISKEHYQRVIGNIGSAWRNKTIELNSFESDKYAIDKIVDDFKNESLISFTIKKIKGIIS